MTGQSNFTNLSTTKPQYQANSNPFARALAETEKQSVSGNTGSDQVPSPNFPSRTQSSQEQLLKQNQEKMAQERLRRQFHDRVNPVNAKDVFNARKEQVKKEIEQLRYELKMLSQEIKKFHKEVEVTLMANVADPGLDGTYFRNFFQQLRYWIMLFRQQVHSARTWANQFSSKSKKKRARKMGAGIMIEGADHEQTKSIFDTMHHERSNAYGG